MDLYKVYMINSTSGNIDYLLAELQSLRSTHSIISCQLAWTNSIRAYLRIYVESKDFNYNLLKNYLPVTFYLPMKRQNYFSN